MEYHQGRVQIVKGMTGNHQELENQKREVSMTKIKGWTKIRDNEIRRLVR